MFQTTLYIYLSEGITPELGVYPNIVKLVVKLFRTHRLLLGAGARVGLTQANIYCYFSGIGVSQKHGEQNSISWF